MGKRARYKDSIEVITTKKNEKYYYRMKGLREIFCLEISQKKIDEIKKDHIHYFKCNPKRTIATTKITIETLVK